MIARRTEDGAAVAFDRGLASEAWRFVPEGRALECWPGCLVKGELFVFAHGSEVFALRVADGALAWRFATGEAGVVNMVPAAEGGAVFFGAEHGSFFALEAGTGRELWRAETGGWLGWTHPVVVDGLVVCADRGSARGEAGNLERRGQLWALSTRDGRERWHADFGATGFSTPGVGEGFVVGGYGTVVARFDLRTGRPDERTVVRTGRNPFGSPTVVGESLVFGNLDGRLYVHALDSGELRWSFRLPEEAQVHDFVHAGDRIFVSTTLGLFCLGDEPGRPPAPPGFVLEWEETEPGPDRRR